jgi:hypothetical protein
MAMGKPETECISMRLGTGKSQEANVPRSNKAECKFAKVKDYALARGYSVSFIRRLLKEGLPRFGQGRYLRIRIAEADEWIQSRGRDSADSEDKTSKVRTVQ